MPERIGSLCLQVVSVSFPLRVEIFGFEFTDICTLAAISYPHLPPASAATSPAISRLSPERQIVFPLRIAQNQTKYPAQNTLP
jgi:hypothetical protein